MPVHNFSINIYWILIYGSNWLLSFPIHKTVDISMPFLWLDSSITLFIDPAWHDDVIVCNLSCLSVGDAWLYCCLIIVVDLERVNFEAVAWFMPRCQVNRACLLFLLKESFTLPIWFNEPTRGFHYCLSALLRHLRNKWRHQSSLEPEKKVISVPLNEWTKKARK